MTILLSCFALVYIILTIIVFFESRQMKYGFIISTLMGLLFPMVLFSETSLNLLLTIVNFLHTKFTALILILCGTDTTEFQNKMVERILEAENDE